MKTIIFYYKNGSKVELPNIKWEETLKQALGFAKKNNTQLTGYELSLGGEQ